MASTIEPSSAEPDILSQRLRIAEERLEQGLLPELELFWRDHYSWLKDYGYLLRPRYSPDWTPSWKTGGCKPEDDVMPPFSTVVDAVRISDGALVSIKKTEPERNDLGVFHEDQILRKFSSEPLASDPRNHCIRMIEIISVPDDPGLILIVMPFYYNWTLVPFLTIGEAVEFISQTFEALQFMHSNNVWHGDVKSNNILMDATPLLVEDVNPWKPRQTRDLSRQSRFRNRLQHPVKYYLIDFDLTGVHDPSTGPPLSLPGYGGTRGVPEFANKEQLCDPFPVDVWCLGNMIKLYFTEGEDLKEKWALKKKRGFEFMQPLVADMLNEDPTKRPNMDEIVRRFSNVKAGLSWWKLRSRFSSVDEHPLSRIFKLTPHWSRQLYYTVRRIPAVPTP